MASLPTNAELDALFDAQTAAVRRQPGHFEAGVLDAATGKPMRPDPIDTKAEAAAYVAGYTAWTARTP